MKIVSSSFLTLICSLTAAGQILHSVPDICGSSAAIARNVTATVDHSSHALLFADNPTGIDLTGDSFILEIVEVCSLSDGRVVTFGDNGVGSVIDIVDLAKQTVLDKFLGYNPAMSPDRRWIMFRKFYCQICDGADWALTYDVTKSPDQNRPVGYLDKIVDVGTVVYPRGIKNASFDNIGLPDEQKHGIISEFSWAPDSRAVVFVEWTPEVPMQMVLVTFDGHGASAAFVHPLTEQELCGPDFAGEAQGQQVRSLSVGADQGDDRVVNAGFESGSQGCRTSSVQLGLKDFQPAKPEVHQSEEPPGPVTVLPDGRMMIPAQKSAQKKNDTAGQPQQ